MNHDFLKEKALQRECLITASIELTQHCNFKCLHCYCPSNKVQLDYNDVIASVDKLYNMGVLYLTFTGGEAFLYKRFNEVYLYAKNKGFIISVMSNLSYITDVTKNLLIKYPPKVIMVTLYGTSTYEYENFTINKTAFRKVTDNLCFLHSNNIDFMLKVIISKETIPAALKGKFDDIARIYKKEIMYDAIIFPQKDLMRGKLSQRASIDDIISFEHSDPETITFWRKSISNMTSQACIKCGGGINSLSIDAEGYASICSLYVEDKINFLSNDEKTITKYLRDSHNKMQSYYINSKCSTCEKKTICRWCAAYANLEHGNSSEPIDFMCELAQRRISGFTEEQ
ncbi:radical SAM protein [Citrobacter freundii]|uniref:radical SAM protein n=1 Tax=Citrobacter freundii TaxID=546 RepID=UPI00242C0D01|nr:radical SAM protein [Citrobacter freundii]WFW59008.1 radical SAM protein [Citrobacter freundii]